MAPESITPSWNDRYRADAGAPTALEVLVDNRHLLPAGGHALDLACGLGGSALLIAGLGLQTWAWDSSRAAIDALGRMTGDLPLVPEVRDVVDAPPEAGRFDVICVGHFLDRGLCPAIARALRPGGLLFYQTFTHERVDASGPRNPAYRLGLNELPRLFPGLVLRFYREEGALGLTRQGFRNRAQMVAQLPDQDSISPADDG